MTGSLTKKKKKKKKQPNADRASPFHFLKLCSAFSDSNSQHQVSIPNLKASSFEPRGPPPKKFCLEQSTTTVTASPRDDTWNPRGLPHAILSALSLSHSLSANTWTSPRLPLSNQRPPRSTPIPPSTTSWLYLEDVYLPGLKIPLFARHFLPRFHALSLFLDPMR